MPEIKARVVEIHSSGQNSDGKLNSNEAAKMLQTGLDNLSPTGMGEDLLEKLFPPRETIGLKVNALAGRAMSTAPELAYAFGEICARLGRKKNEIIFWDRHEAELVRAGYSIKAAGSDYLCFATDTVGVGFSQHLHTRNNVSSLFSKIQVELAQSTVNFPILKDHSIAGLSGCLKNNYGLIHNPNKYHENCCDPYLADLYGMELVKGKQKLAIMDATRIQINGGPAYVKRWAMNYNSILLATDALALDRVAYAILDRLRTKSGLMGLKESGREPAAIATAEKQGLGCADLKRIEWIVVNI